MMIRVLAFIKNKYLVASALFVVWMLFFDKNDVFTQIGYYKDVLRLRAQKKFYIQEIAATKEEIKELHSNPQLFEQFAREKYLMKKPNEDVFIVVKESSK